MRLIKIFTLVTLLLNLIRVIGFTQNTVKVYVNSPKLKNGTIIKLIEVNAIKSPEPSNQHEIIIGDGKYFKVIPTGYGDRFQLSLGDKYLEDVLLESGEILIKIPDRGTIC